MSDRLLELLSQNAGMGDEVAALQAQLLRAKGLRTQAQTDPRRTTAKGGMFSALARGVNAYRAGTMEADTETAQAGIDARRAEIMQNLPAIGGPGGAEVAFADNPQAATQAAQQRADQNDQLGAALARTGDPRLAAAGQPYTKDAAEQTGNVLKSALARMGDDTRHDLSMLYEATPISGAPGMYLWKNKHTGDTRVSGELIKGPDGRPVNAGRAGQSRYVYKLTAGGEIVALDPTNPAAPPVRVLAPEGAPGQEVPGERIPLVGGKADDVSKLATDTAYVKQMPEDLALLKKYVGKNAKGVGLLEGLPPNFATSAEGIALRQAGTRITNALLYLNSGKAINEAEVQRILEGLGTGRFDDQDAFNSGVTALDRYVKRAARDFVASRPPAVVALAKQQGVLDALAPWLAGVKGFETPPPPPKKSNLPGATKAPIGAPPPDVKERQKWILQKRGEGYSRDEIAKAMGG